MKPSQVGFLMVAVGSALFVYGVSLVSVPIAWIAVGLLFAGFGGAVLRGSAR
jgi:hypothetical protein